MEKVNLWKATAAIVKQQFDIEEDASEPLTEEAFHGFLSKKIEWMLEYNIELLFSTLYRMDVSEKSVAEAMHPEAAFPAHLGLATLVIKRQMERIRTKIDLKQPPLQEDEDWGW
ncbi:MAG: hypothetical protein HRU40_07700 [Saprospiraceae bacterium]|nr:hypothetical protein [Saprospiraceae bacterium]